MMPLYLYQEVKTYNDLLEIANEYDVAVHKEKYTGSTGSMQRFAFFVTSTNNTRIVYWVCLGDVIRSVNSKIKEVDRRLANVEALLD